MTGQASHCPPSYRHRHSGASATQMRCSQDRLACSRAVDLPTGKGDVCAMRPESFPFLASTAIASRRTYGHRIRQAICATGDPTLFDSVMTIPRSTARSWLRRDRPSIVLLDDEGQELADLRLRVVMLERRIEKYRRAMRKLAVVARLWRAELWAFSVSLESARVPEA